MALISSNSGADEPVLQITNTHAGNTSGELRFNKDSASGGDNDVMGLISFYGTDDDDNTHERLAYMDAIITDSAEGSEAASLRFYVAENDATLTQGLLIAGQADSDGEVDVTLGAGAASTATVAGTLTVTGAVTLSSIAEVGSDVDKFLCSDSGVVKYVDGADLATYIGAVSTAAASTFTAKQQIDLAAANLTPAADGSHFHVEGGVTMTDNNTSNSGTAAAYSQVSFEAVTLAASNSSVTTTNAATVYISAAPTAGTNQTLTNALALQVGVDDAGGDVKFYGAAAGAFAHWDESADTLILQGATAAGAGALKLTTGELTVVDGDILGRIDFQAPLESSGTDAILVAASIWAEADDTFAAGVNTCSLVFATPAAATGTATASEVLRISSLGNVTPIGNGTQDLGGSSNRWKDIYTSDMNFANDRGDWTLIEENDYITFRNNNTGRRFRMMMEDITDTDDYGPDINGNM